MSDEKKVGYMEDVLADVAKAKGEVASNDADFEDFREAALGAGELEDMTEMSFIENVRDGLARDEAFMRDPARAAIEEQRYFARAAQFKGAKKNEAKETPPADLTPEARLEWEIEQETKRVYREGDRAKKIREDYEANKELIAQVRKRYPGKKLVELRDGYTEYHREGRRDPVGTARRASGVYGFPLTWEQAQLEARTAHRYGEAASTLDAVLKSGQLPELGRDDVQQEMARLIESGAVPRTGDREADLARAYARAMERLTPKPKRERKANLDDDIYADAEDGYRAHR